MNQIKVYCKDCRAYLGARVLMVDGSPAVRHRDQRIRGYIHTGDGLEFVGPDRRTGKTTTTSFHESGLDGAVLIARWNCTCPGRERRAVPVKLDKVIAAIESRETKIYI